MSPGHADHEVRLVHPRRVERLGPVPMVYIPSAFERGTGSVVHRFAGVPPPGAGAAHHQPVPQHRAVDQHAFCREVPEHNVAHRRSADISGADEDHPKRARWAIGRLCGLHESSLTLPDGLVDARHIRPPLQTPVRCRG